MSEPLIAATIFVASIVATVTRPYREMRRARRILEHLPLLPGHAAGGRRDILADAPGLRVGGIFPSTPTEFAALVFRAMIVASTIALQLNATRGSVDFGGR
jgi:hypothetical protein